MYIFLLGFNTWDTFLSNEMIGHLKTLICLSFRKYFDLEKRYLWLLFFGTKLLEDPISLLPDCCYN